MNFTVYDEELLKKFMQRTVILERQALFSCPLGGGRRDGLAGGGWQQAGGMEGMRVGPHTDEACEKLS